MRLRKLTHQRKSDPHAALRARGGPARPAETCRTPAAETPPRCPVRCLARRAAKIAPSTVSRTSMLPPVGVNLSALLSRFQTICSSRTGSASIAAAAGSSCQVQRQLALRRIDLQIASQTRAIVLGAVDACAVQAQLAGAQARQIEQVVDDLGLTEHGAPDHVGRLRHRRRLARCGQSQQQLGIHEDQVQRVLQLVRHHGQKLFLQGERARQFGRGGLLLGQRVLRAAPRCACPRSDRARCSRSRPARRPRASA